MAAVTPSGWRIIISSIPLATSSRLYPCISVGMPQATSTFSMARRSSARDSTSGFAVFRGADTRDFLEIVFQQLLHLEEILNAILRRGAAPVGICRSGGANGSVDVLLGS